MKPVKNAKRYAKQFLNAVGMEKAPEALKELALINDLIEKSPDVRNFMLSPLFLSAERQAALVDLGKKLNLSEQTIKFIGYLADLKAAAAIGQVIQAAVAIYSEKMKKAKATVITSAPMDAQYEARLKQSLLRVTGREVDIEYTTDSSLLGGMLVKVGSVIYDGSIRGQLRLLKDELVKG